MQPTGPLPYLPAHFAVAPCRMRIPDADIYGHGDSGCWPSMQVAFLLFSWYTIAYLQIGSGPGGLCVLSCFPQIVPCQTVRPPCGLDGQLVRHVQPAMIYSPGRIPSATDKIELLYTSPQSGDISYEGVRLGGLPAQWCNSGQLLGSELHSLRSGRGRRQFWRQGRSAH